MDISFHNLVRLCLKLQKGAVFRRLGYFLEFYGLAEEPLLNLWREQLNFT